MNINPKIFYCASSPKWNLFRWGVIAVPQSGDCKIDTGSVSGLKTSLDAECYAVLQAIHLADEKSSIEIFSEGFAEESIQKPVFNLKGFSPAGLGYSDLLRYQVFKNELSVAFRIVPSHNNPARIHFCKTE